MNKNCNNWRVAFLQLCIDTNAEAEFSPLECTQIEHLYATLRTDGSEAAERYAMACDGRCLALWNKYKDAAK